MAKRTCSIESCERKNYARGLCTLHYDRLRRRGPLPPYIPLQFVPERPASPPVEERFWGRVDKDGPVPDYAPHLGPCWLWTGALTTWGYGHASFEGRMRMAHVLALTWAKGAIPDGFQVDHLCRVTRCVNPAHLEAVTPQVNQLRGFGVSGVNARKTHCPKGHPYDEVNTRVYGGKRSCLTCIAERAK